VDYDLSTKQNEIAHSVTLDHQKDNTGHGKNAGKGDEHVYLRVVKSNFEIKVFFLN
jgi:hypothetical protein